MNHAGTVYILDDDPAARRTLRRVLEAANLQILVFSSRDEFLAAATPPHPSCLLLDPHLPGTTGPQLLLQLRQPDRRIPVILTTAHPDVPLLLQALKLGVLGMCPKPVDPAELLPLVRQGLRQDKHHAQVETARQRLAALTPREREIVALLVEGKSYKEIAQVLAISIRTVEHHRAHLNGKLGTDRLADLIQLHLWAGPLADSPPPW